MTFIAIDRRGAVDARGLRWMEGRGPKEEAPEAPAGSVLRPGRGVRACWDYHPWPFHWPVMIPELRG